MQTLERTPLILGVAFAKSTLEVRRLLRACSVTPLRHIGPLHSCINDGRFIPRYSRISPPPHFGPTDWA